MSRLLVAIDGPAGSGKSTVAKGLAGQLGLPYIDTGAMYRALALKALNKGIDVADEDTVVPLLTSTKIEVDGDKVYLDGVDASGLLRSREVTEASSQVAQYPSVRSWMVKLQRQLVDRHSGGAVVEGRDIGAVVLPEAHIKVYLTASMGERAKRRASDDSSDDVDATLKEVQGRDRRDSERAASPLAVAPGAVVIDTTGLSAEEVVAEVMLLVGAVRT